MNRKFIEMQQTIKHLKQHQQQENRQKLAIKLAKVFLFLAASTIHFDVVVGLGAAGIWANKGFKLGYAVGAYFIASIVISCLGIYAHLNNQITKLILIVLGLRLLNLTIIISYAIWFFKWTYEFQTNIPHEPILKVVTVMHAAWCTLMLLINMTLVILMKFGSTNNNANANANANNSNSNSNSNSSSISSPV